MFLIWAYSVFQLMKAFLIILTSLLSNNNVKYTRVAKVLLPKIIMFCFLNKQCSPVSKLQDILCAIPLPENLKGRKKDCAEGVTKEIKGRKDNYALSLKNATYLGLNGRTLPQFDLVQEHVQNPHILMAYCWIQLHIQLCFCKGKLAQLKCFYLIFSEERFNLDLKVILKYYSIVLTGKNHRLAVTG